MPFQFTRIKKKTFYILNTNNIAVGNNHTLPHIALLNIRSYGFYIKNYIYIIQSSPKDRVFH